MMTARGDHVVIEDGKHCLVKLAMVKYVLSGGEDAVPTTHLGIVREFLKERKDPLDIPECGFPFITISRQAGAGSHLLCDTLREDFRKQSSDLFRGWHVFDQLICEAVAQDPELSRSMEDFVREHYESEFQDLMDTLIAGTSSSYLLCKKTFQVITMLAAIGKVIIVGRGACCVTEPLGTGIHVRIVASEAQRIINTMKRLKVGRDEALKDMRERDSERRKLLKRFFNKDIDDPLLYDVVWNTDRVEMREISAALIRLVEHRAGRSE